MTAKVAKAGRPLWKRFRKQVEAAGTKVTGLAAELGVHRQLLVNYLQRGQGIPILRAKEIHRLTGWPIASWPRISKPRPKPRKGRC